MEMGMVADMEVDKVVDKVADMVADIEVDKVANMKVDKVADMAVDMFKTKCIKCEMCIVQCVLGRSCDAKCTRLACLLSFASLLFYLKGAFPLNWWQK